MFVFSKQETYEENAEFRFLTSGLPEDEKTVTGKLLSYLAITPKTQLGSYPASSRISTRSFFENGLLLKVQSRIESIHSKTGQKHGTLLWLLDETKTAMGARLLKQWLDRPLIQPKKIFARQEMVQSLLDSFFERADLQDALTKVYDMERLVGRVAFGNVNGRIFCS